MSSERLIGRGRRAAPALRTSVPREKEARGAEAGNITSAHPKVGWLVHLQTAMARVRGQTRQQQAGKHSSAGFHGPHREHTEK